MNKKENEPVIWDSIWNNSNNLTVDIELLKSQIKITKQSKKWKIYTDIVTEKFGGWHNVVSIEIGAGMGWHSMVAETEGAKVFLLDYSEAAIELAKKRFRLLNISAEYISGNAFDIQKHRNVDFNLSWSFGTAEHFSEELRQDFFNLHFQYINLNGVAIISCPYKYAINYRIWMYYAKKYNVWEFGLEIPFSKKEFLRKLDVSGNKLIKILYDEGNPCLKKVIPILRKNSKIRYYTIGVLLKFFQKSNIKIPPFCYRSIILIGTKN